MCALPADVSFKCDRELEPESEVVDQVHQLEEVISPENPVLVHPNAAVVFSKVVRLLSVVGQLKHDLLLEHAPLLGRGALPQNDLDLLVAVPQPLRDALLDATDLRPTDKLNVRIFLLHFAPSARSTRLHFLHDSLQFNDIHRNFN